MIITAQTLDISNNSLVTFRQWANNTNKIVADLNELNITKTDEANTSVFALKSIAAANTYVNQLLANTNVYIATKLNSSAYTAADVLTKMKTVDGDGSGLDADLLDGQDSAYYLSASNLNAGIVPNARLGGTYTGFSINNSTGSVSVATVTVTGTMTFGSLLSSTSTSLILSTQTGGTFSIRPNGSGSTVGQLVVGTSTFSYAGSTIWHSGNDGSGSGLDADLLDGHDSSYFLNTSTAVDATTLNGQAASYYLPTNSYTAADVLTKLKTVDGSTSGLDADLLDGHDSTYYLPTNSYTAADVLAKINSVGGTGSGLDADLLDGQQGSYYLPASSYTAGDVLAKLKTVDGVGSGLDADLLDGQSGAYYLSASNLSGTISSARLTGSYTGITGVGSLNAGSISSGFGDINIGANQVTCGTLSATGTSYFGSYLVSTSATAILATGSTGTIYFRPVAYNSGTGQAYLTSGGTMVLSGDLTANSDARIKTNVKTITNALDLVNKLRGVEFDRIDNGRHGIGVIAQELEAVLPDLVYTNEENGLKSVAYANLVGVLINAIQELSAMIKEK